LEMLTRLLIPAYMAQNFAALCIDQDVQFPAEVNDGTALVGAFADHVKKEVGATARSSISSSKY
jgi:hypothetical protein